MSRRGQCIGGHGFGEEHRVVVVGHRVSDESCGRERLDKRASSFPHMAIHRALIVLHRSQTFVLVLVHRRPLSLARRPSRLASLVFIPHRTTLDCTSVE